jgi:hypothetical protein
MDGLSPPYVTTAPRGAGGIGSEVARGSSLVGHHCWHPRQAPPSVVHYNFATLDDLVAAALVEVNDRFIVRFTADDLEAILRHIVG